MNAPLQTGTLIALAILGIWWLAFRHMSDQSVKLEEPGRPSANPVIKPAPVPTPRQEIVKPLPKPVPAPKPVVYPTDFYAKVRITRFQEEGVQSIPKGEQIVLLGWDDGRALIRFGKLKTVVDADEITCDAREIAKLKRR